MHRILFQKESYNTRIEALMNKEFGKDRHEKHAYRFRNGIPAAKGLSFVMMENNILVGSLRFWSVVMKSNHLTDYNVLLLGPIAVQREFQGIGLGVQLMQHGIKAAQNLGFKAVILIGDEAYYKKIGFSKLVAEHLKIDGFDDYDRLLGLEFEEGHLTSQNWHLNPAELLNKQKVA